MARTNSLPTTSLAAMMGTVRSAACASGGGRQRSPSAKSELPKADAMTTPIAESGRVGPTGDLAPDQE